MVYIPLFCCFQSVFGLAMLGNDLAVYNDGSHVVSGGSLVGNGKHDLLHDRTETSRARTALDRESGDGFDRVVREDQLLTVQTEQLLILLDDRIFRFLQNTGERILVQIFQTDDHGQTSDELGNESVFDDVVRRRVLINIRLFLFGLGFDLAAEADGGFAVSLLDDLFESVKRAATDEENILRIHLNEILSRVLSAALGRYVGNRTLEDLQKRLLYALARNVAGDGTVFASAGLMVSAL